MIDQLGLDAWQLVLLGVAAVILMSIFFNGDVKKPKLIFSNKPNEDIIRIVSAWSSFKRECVNAGLTEASKKVDDIFPLLIISNKDNHLDKPSNVDINGRDIVV